MKKLLALSTLLLMACNGVDQGHITAMNSFIGMTEKDVRMSWGKPDTVRRIRTGAKTITFKDKKVDDCKYSFNIVNKRVAGWYQLGDDCPVIKK